MKTITKTSLAALAGASIALAGAATAQTAGIATAQADAAIFSAKAFDAANQQISTTYKAQLDQAAAAQNTLNTQLRTLLDTNKDGQISQAEAAAAEGNGAVANQVRAAQAKAQPAIEAAQGPAIKAQAYALEQVTAKYDPALRAVVAAKKISIVLAPNAIQYAPPATDVTRDIIAEIDRSTPTVSITPPANWQPQQQTVELLQQYRQLVYANAARRQQAGAPAPAAGTPAPAAGATPRATPQGR
ncbi:MULTISPECIES: OmpH family outer membrane protein [Sphingomonas]|uniref:OmpH family outer membrane protein n=1 Tax=Sphingomonas kyungheensis TaxID=1069987 RepID=A0ABU8H1W3_9SPHN|nr:MULTISPECIES: OmpH family outer membrane protein [unclassified Sphingomonas]EZP50383.1 Outer membrane family protein [Sphingomonas sp. RIT328]